MPIGKLESCYFVRVKIDVDRGVGVISEREITVS